MSDGEGIVVSYPGVMQHAQQIARACFEAGRLRRYVSTFAPRLDRWPLASLASAKGGARAAIWRKLQRRRIEEVPADFVDSRNIWEIARLLSANLIRDPKVTDGLWDRMSFDFDRYVARSYARSADVSEVHAFEYTALESFAVARAAGKRSVLHLPSIENAAYREIEQRELEAFPELVTPERAYYDARFAVRQERRNREKESADLIVCNSRATANSHIQAGADARKVCITPLGGPPPVPADAIRLNPTTRPLRVLWAGPFSVRKGAHYFLEACRKAGARRDLLARVFGSIGLPARLMASAPACMEFCGAVGQAQLFEEFLSADVLVFPTLCDGFGMVVTEALAHGLPVITTEAAGAADLVRHGENGLIVPSANAPALADAIEWCVDNRLALQAMKVRALATAEGNQWSHFRERLIAVIGDASPGISLIARPVSEATASDRVHIHASRRA